MLRNAFEEAQIFRIDHFLGKEAVQNILALRFANGLFEPAWNRHTIESVQIDVPEKLTVEGRGSFYEGTGCLRDMVTTHLCQLLGFVALEDPHAYRESALRAAKAAVFAAVRPLDPERVVFGQYDGYRDEPDVAEDSDVETFVAIEMWIDNDRWRDVPFYLRTGKAMADGRRTITIRFIDPRHRWLKPARRRPARAQRAGHRARRPAADRDRRPRQATRPRHGHRRGRVPARPGRATPRTPTRSRPTSGCSSTSCAATAPCSSAPHEVERLWEICQPVLEHRPAVQPYPQGSWGPEARDRPADRRLAARQPRPGQVTDREVAPLRPAAR